ncbi:MAG: protease modulator HflK, partial [Castellaniella sp.]
EYTKAPDITRDRIYLETMQDILSDTAKVMIDAPVGNNMLYLPLDKIMNQVGSGKGGSSSSGSGGTGSSSSSSSTVSAAASAQTSSSKGAASSPASSTRGSVPSGLNSLMSSPYSN